MHHHLVIYRVLLPLHANAAFGNHPDLFSFGRPLLTLAFVCFLYYFQCQIVSLRRRLATSFFVVVVVVASRMNTISIDSHRIGFLSIPVGFSRCSRQANRINDRGEVITA